MAQFARPDGDITNTGTGGWADIDEASASDADFWYGANNTAEELEVSLTNISDPAQSTGHIFRYRIAKVNNGVLDGGGNAVTVQATLRQGTTAIAIDTARTATGTWTTYTFTLGAEQADLISDYNDLRLEFVTSASGGSPANRRGGAVSWAELEVPSVGAIEYTDSATVSIDLQASGSEKQEAVDSATTPLILTPSSLEAHESTDDAAVYLTLTASGVEFQGAEYSDSATVYLDLQVTEIPFGVLIDDFTGSDGSIDGRTALNGDTWHVGVGETVNIVSNQIGSAFGGASLDGPYGPDVRVWITVVTPPTGDWDNYIQLSARDNGTAKYALLLYPGTDTNLRTVLTSPFTWIDWQTVTVTAGDKLMLEVIGNHVRAYHYTGGVWTLVSDQIDNTLSAAGKIGFVRDPTGGGDIVIDDFGGGTAIPELAEFVDSATIYLDLQPSSAEIIEAVDSAEVYLNIEASGTELVERTDESTVKLTLTPSSVQQYIRYLTADFEAGTDGNTITTSDPGSGDAWDEIVIGSGATLTYDDAHAYDSLAAHFTTGASAAQAYLQWVQDEIRNQYGRIYIYPVASWTSDQPLILPRCSNGTGNGIISIGASNKIGLWNNTPTKLATSTNSLPLNQWSRIEFRFVHANPTGQGGIGGEIEVKLFLGANANGTTPDETLLLTDIDTFGSSYTQAIRFGQSNAQANKDFYLDNIVASATTWPGPVAVIYQDAATANLILTPSSVEAHEISDEATVYLTLTPSSEEAVESADASTIYLVSTPSSAEYVEHADSATIPLALLPSSVEAAEWIDAQTIYLTITPSGVDEYQPSFTQTPTDRVALTADTPATRTDHYIYVVCSITNNAHDGVMRFQLYEGSTAIGSVFETDPLTTTPTEFAFHLPDADAEDIVDYTNLELEFYGYSGSGDPTEFHFHEAWLVLPAPSEAETTDSATIYLKLTASGVDVFEAVDSATVPLDLVASGIEAREITDAETIYVDLQTSGVEAREATDAETIYVDIEPATADIAEFADAQTTYLDLEASGVDVYVPSEGIEYTDAATVYLDIAPDSLEERVATDADTVLLAMAISSADIAVFVDTEQVVLLLTPTGVEAIEHVDAETIYLDIEATGTEVLEAVDSAETYIDIQASGVEYVERTDQQTVYVDLTASGVDVVEYVDSATTYLLFTITGDEYIAGQYVDIGSVYFNLLASSVELAEYVEAQTIYLDLQPNSAELRESSDEETVPFALSPSGTDISIFVDQATTYLDLQASGVEEHAAGGVFTDASTVLIDIQASGADILEASDAYSAYLDLTPSSVDIAEFYDAETVNIYMFPTALELREQYDADTIYVDIQPDSVEVAIFTDTAVVGLLITPTSADIAEFVDAQTIYLVLTPGRVYEYEDADTVYLKLTPSEAAIILAILSGYILSRRYSGTVSSHYAGSVLGRRLSAFFDRRWKGEHHRRWLR